MYNIILEGGPYNGMEKKVKGKTWSIDIVEYAGNIAIKAHRYNWSRNINEERVSVFRFDKTY